jgi:superfamily II DNA/RNA helicase
VVFDEADRLFELGFAEQLHELLQRLPGECVCVCVRARAYVVSCACVRVVERRQTSLFSATLPEQLVVQLPRSLCDVIARVCPLDRVCARWIAHTAVGTTRC